jgi:calcium-dependent protein kinase
MTVPVSESNSSAGNFSENYWIDTASCIGKGKGMTVRVCYHRKTKLKYAVKSVQKKKVKAVEHLKNEIEMMRELSQHKKINTLMDFYEDEKQVYFVSELCTGGHLGNFIQTKVIDNSSIDYKKVEHEALTIIKQILDALAHCHEKNIVHRDLKLENILLKRARQLDIRLIDFDISTRHDDEIDEKMTKLVGTRVSFLHIFSHIYIYI